MLARIARSGWPHLAGIMSSAIFRRTNKDILRVLKTGLEMLANIQQELGMMFKSRRETGKASKQVMSPHLKR